MSGHYIYITELPEMLIERGGGRNLQVVDDDLAGAICEAPAGSGALLEENPVAVHLLGCNEMKPHQVDVKKDTAGDESTPPMPSGNEQC